MTNVRAKTKKPAKNTQVLAAKNRQAREAAKVQKTTVSNAPGRGRNVAMDANDENINSITPRKPNRRSCRLNPTTVSTAGIAAAADSYINPERLPKTANVPRTRRKASATQATKCNHADTGTEMTTDDDACNMALPSSNAKAQSRKGTGRSEHSSGNGGGQRSADQRRNGMDDADMTEDKDAQPDVSDELDSIQDLRRQLQEEKGYLSKSNLKIISGLTRFR